MGLGKEEDLKKLKKVFEAAGHVRQLKFRCKPLVSSGIALVRYCKATHLNQKG